MEYSFSKISSYQKELNNWFDLFNTCFGKRPLLNNEWYYWNNISYKENNTYVVKSEDKIIASYSLYPLKVKYDNQIKDGYLCHNVMTHPKHGGKGLFTQLGKYAISDTSKDSILIGVPNENAIRGHLKVGWEEYPNIPFYTKTDFNSYSISNITQIDSFSFNKFEVEQFYKPYNFCIIKDSEFLNWRYINRPNIEYMCYKLIDNSGFIVLKQYENKLHIIDYGFINGDSFIKLLKFTENKAQELNSKIIEFWCYSNKDQNTLHQLGFNKSNQLDNKLILLSTPPIEFNLNSNWKIVLGDNDVF